MSTSLLLGFLTALATSPAPAASSGLPPISPELEGASAVACVRIGDMGVITDAFLARSTGDAERDRRLLEWIRMLRWPAADPGAARRDMWFPVPMAIGDGVKAPEGPSTCTPPAPTDM
jgi:hypothetical protein